MEDLGPPIALEPEGRRPASSEESPWVIRPDDGVGAVGADYVAGGVIDRWKERLPC